MAGHKARRIAKDLADIRADTASQIFAETVGDSITNLRGSFKGPSGTPYEGGTYEVSITIPNEYPFKPPVMRFITKVWHPNISSQTVSHSNSNFRHVITNLFPGCYLSRYPEHGLVAGFDHQVRDDFLAVAAEFA